MTITDTLATVGTAAFGLTMPRVAPAWTSGPTPTFDDSALTLSLGDGSWLAPIGAQLSPVDAARPMGVTLNAADGSPVTGPGVLLTLWPTAHLRLTRLYAARLEATPVAADRSRRPVPKYFFVAGTPPTGGPPGLVEPGDDLEMTGALSIHDADGHPIDPTAVAAVFVQLMSAHHPLQARPIGDAFDPTPELADVTGLGTAGEVRVRLVDGAGAALPAARQSHVTGLSALNATTGVGTLDDQAGGGSDLTGTLSKADATADDGAFPASERRRYLLGLATNGRLSDTVTFPAAPAGVNLARDFFTARVLDLGPYLLGTPDPAWDGTKVESPPEIRLNEPLDLLADGNDLLGAIGAAIGPDPALLTDSHAVAPTQSTNMELPPASGASAHWPAFPPGGAAVDPSAVLLSTVRAGIQATAAFTLSGDVMTTISGLPNGVWVRAFSRIFTEQATERRGNGAGGRVDGSSVTLLLDDPFELRSPGDTAATLPVASTLHLDLALVLPNGRSRIVGNITAAVDPGPVAAPAPAATNGLGVLSAQGVSHAAMLGLSAPPLTPSADPLGAVLEFFGEGTPREAARMPTMARRDLLVATLPAGTPTTDRAWNGVLGAGRLTGEVLAAQPGLGAPGGPGGRETQTVGVATSGGRLALDIASMAARRTLSIAPRLAVMFDDRFAPPTEPTEPADPDNPPAGSGPFAGAVLQTVARACESPELSLVRVSGLVDPANPPNPPTFAGLVTQLVDGLQDVIDAIPSGIPFRSQAVDRLNDLRDEVIARRDDPTGDVAAFDRLRTELLRELAVSGWGRRDAQWALEGALGRARRFVYIESPALAATAVADGGNPLGAESVDLFGVLGSRLAAAPGLRVIVCVPRLIDAPTRYATFAAHELADRAARLLGLPTAEDPDPERSRVVAFHPIGFPGRPSNIESTTVIVDDVWVMVGSSSFRRRGLTFDGGADVVFTDTRVVDGVSPAIRDFRRSIMAQRIGIPAVADDGGTHPEFVRLGDGAEAASVIRSRSRAGGLGRIERLHREEPAFAGLTPADAGLANPDGEQFFSAYNALHAQLLSLHSPPT